MTNSFPFSLHCPLDWGIGIGDLGTRACQFRLSGKPWILSEFPSHFVIRIQDPVRIFCNWTRLVAAAGNWLWRRVTQSYVSRWPFWTEITDHIVWTWSWSLGTSQRTSPCGRPSTSSRGSMPSTPGQTSECGGKNIFSLPLTNWGKRL